MIATAFLILQFIISAKAGLVNAVDGTANVHVQEQVPAGAPIQTGPSGHVEMLLNPTTFLRLGEDSQAVLDSVDLTDVQVRILSGSAIIECSAVEKDSRITVTDGKETLSISSPGVYRFPEGTASAPLDEWNNQRSELIAAANARSADTDSASNGQGFQIPGPPLYPGAVWPNGLFPGTVSPVGPFSFFSSYGGGYRFYQPLVTTPPFLFYPPFFRPIPRPLPILPHPPMHPPTTRPIVPAPRPAPSRIGARVAHGHR